MRPQPASRTRFPIISPTISFPPMLVDRPAASSLSSRKMAGRRAHSRRARRLEENDVQPCSLRSTHWPTATSSTVYRHCSARSSSFFPPFGFYVHLFGRQLLGEIRFTQIFSEFRETFVNCKNLLFEKQKRLTCNPCQAQTCQIIIREVASFLLFQSSFGISRNTLKFSIRFRIGNATFKYL